MARHASSDNLLISALHGTAWRHAANLGSMEEAVTELAGIANGRLDLLAQAAGVDAGSWYAKPSADGIQLLIAGLLVSVSGNIDNNDLVRWTREGYDRARASTHGTQNFPDPTHVRERARQQGQAGADGHLGGQLGGPR